MSEHMDKLSDDYDDMLRMSLNTVKFFPVEDGWSFMVTRVPGGWLYMHDVGEGVSKSVFIPLIADEMGYLKKV